MWLIDVADSDGSFMGSPVCCITAVVGAPVFDPAPPKLDAEQEFARRLQRSNF
jgi:hypothetical protein